MNEHEYIKKALSGLHASENTLEEVMKKAGERNRQGMEAVTYEHGKNRRSLKWCVVAACIGLVLVSIWRLNLGQAGGLILTAYASEDDGIFSSYAMQQGVSVPLSLIEIGPGLDGFLFSCPLDDTNKLSEIVFLSAQYFPEKPINQLQKYMEETGLQYFYYMPEENESTPINFEIHIGYIDGSRFECEIEINSSQDGHTATLRSLTIQ